MDFELLGLELINVFKVTHNDLMFFGRNIQSENLEYSLKLESLNPELILTLGAGDIDQIVETIKNHFS